MIPIEVRNAPRDYQVYNDIWDKLYAQKLNKEMNSWNKFLMTDLPNNAVSAYKDIYSAYQYDKDMKRQDELDELDRKLKEQEYATTMAKQKRMEELQPYRQQIMDSMKKAFEEAPEEERLKYMPYLSLGGIYGY